MQIEEQASDSWAAVFAKLMLGAIFLLLLLKINAKIYMFLPSVPPYMQSGGWIVGLMWTSLALTAYDVWHGPEVDVESDGEIIVRVLALLLFTILCIAASITLWIFR